MTSPASAAGEERRRCSSWRQRNRPSVTPCSLQFVSFAQLGWFKTHPLPSCPQRGAVSAQPHSHSYKSGLFLPPRPARFPLPQSCSPQPDSILVLLSGLAKNKTSQTADLGALPAATASIAGEWPSLEDQLGGSCFSERDTALPTHQLRFILSIWQLLRNSAPPLTGATNKVADTTSIRNKCKVLLEVSYPTPFLTRHPNPPWVFYNRINPTNEQVLHFKRN